MRWSFFHVTMGTLGERSREQVALKIRLLPSAVDGPSTLQFATSYLINGTVAIDAGSLGFADLADQLEVRHLFLSHAHADHVGTLPVFVENVYAGTEDCVTVWGSEHVLDSLQRDLFNGRLFPDLLQEAPPGAPFLNIERLQAEAPVSVEELEILPVPVDHTVPTMGFVVKAGDGAVVIASDTAPTSRIWEISNDLADLRAVFLECSFPNRMGELAEVSGHLTPLMLGAEAAKLERQVPIIAVHLKARFHDETAGELAALGMPNLEVGIPGKEYEL